VSYASDSLEFIYVRVPRTASGTFCSQLEEQFPRDMVDVGHMHATAASLREIWGEKWNRYFTFGFIRNPWDWLVSVYNAGLSIGPDEDWPGARIEPHDTPGIHPGQRMNYTFDEWVRRRKTGQLYWLDGVKKVYRFEDYILGNRATKNAMEHRPYREWYSPGLAQHVLEKCAGEVVIGNYEF